MVTRYDTQDVGADRSNAQRWIDVSFVVSLSGRSA
jgi:hypothetical protein